MCTMDHASSPGDQKIVRTGTILSTVSAALIILQGILHIVRTQWALELGLGELHRRSLRGLDFKVLGAGTIILGAMVLVGTYFIRTGRVREGAITVIVSSVLSIFVGGGYLAGLVLGVIGGALALTHYQPDESIQMKST